MIREINIVAKGEEGPIELTAAFFTRCEKENLIPVEIKFGVLSMERKGKTIARMLLKGLIDDGVAAKKRGGEGMPVKLEDVVAKARETGRFMITATVLYPDGNMDHHFVMENFPTNEMLNAQFEHERLVRKEKMVQDKK